MSEKYTVSRGERLKSLLLGAQASMAQIHAEFPEEARVVEGWNENLPVALVMGGPRGGTSAFKASLSQHSKVLAMPGEHRLFFTLLAQNYPDASQSTEASLDVPDSETLQLIRSLILTCAFSGPAVASPNKDEIRRYALDWSIRLPLQWTSHQIDPVEVIDLVENTTELYVQSGSGDLNRLDSMILNALAKRYPFIDLNLYDGAPKQQNDWPRLRNDITPIIEITPFVIPRPRRLKDASTVPSVLLLKASSDPFRLSALRKLFSHQSVTILRLTRNPLASINGLLDGWKHHTFWQHDLTELCVPEQVTGWCFDLFPGWGVAASNSNLVDIAAMQWLEPNRLLLAAEASPAANEKWDRFRFEDFQRSSDSRSYLLDTAVTALGLDPADTEFRAAVVTPPEVNVTSKPTAARWKIARPSLAKLIERSDIASVSKALGYDLCNTDGCI